MRAYDDNSPFSSDQLRVHRRTMALRQQAGGVRSAVESSTFIESLYVTRNEALTGLDDLLSKDR